MRRNEGLWVLFGTLAYLAGLGYAITFLSFDLWGAFIIGPPFAWVTWYLMRRLFRGSLYALFAPMMAGYALKTVGSVARYWVAFDAYGGSTDAQRYHLYGKQIAGRFWAGEVPVQSVLPGGYGTQFVERTTAMLYTVVGSSKLAGFVVFGTLAYWGVALFVKAACTAIPGVARRRYAWLCAFTPSLVYWPSSIGKESLMMFFLGIGTVGLARLVAGRPPLGAIVLAAVGLGLAGSIRSHVAALWLAGLLPAVVVGLGRLLGGSDTRANRASRTVVLAVVAVLGTAAFISAAGTAVEYISASDEQESFTQSVTEVLRETTRRSDQGGSNFRPPTVNSPLDWPYASLRTLTRPVLFEWKGTFQFVTALEMTALIALWLFSLRRLTALPYWLLRNPYVTFVATVLFAGGLAYSSFANLGILARQKSLLFPFLLLLPCLPVRPTQTYRPAPTRSMIDEYQLRPQAITVDR